MEGLLALVQMFARRWTGSLAGAAIAGALIWYLLPLVPALRPPGPRIAGIVLVFAGVIGVNAILAWRRRRRDGALSRSITGLDAHGARAGDASRDARETQAEAAAEVARLRARLAQAVARLRKRGRVRLAEQPWFVLIGPPGAGKTTALRHAGLHFPLDDADEAAIGGVGGTRLCDWWFAEEAVLIDTAGRYTTQDSDAAIDRAGWQGFLDVVRRARPRQPINGVLVVLPASLLAEAGAAERSSHARAVRRRIDEMTERLGQRVPVYLVLSKADQLAGFDATFDDLDATARGQVWGMTFATDQGAECFAAEFRLLLERLDERLIERLQAERSAERRALIAGFPTEVASLAEPLEQFLGEAFAGSRLDPAPFLRGVYLTSATQEGTPVERVTGLLARAFGIDQRRAPSLRPVAGRGYFLSGLVRDVILEEALLVSTSPRLRRRRRLLRVGVLSTLGLVTATLLLLVWRTDASNRAALRRQDEAMAAYRGQLSGVALDPVKSGDLAQVAPILDAAAALVPAAPPFGAALGLSQAAKQREAGALAYTRALQRIMLPRLLVRLETAMHAALGDPDRLYELTRVYLMLGGAGPLDPALVRASLQADWATAYPGTLNEGLRADFARHLDALLAQPLPAIPLDGGLVETARATFSRVSPAARIYGRIQAEAGNRPGFSPAAALGPDGAAYFVRPSGQGLAGQGLGVAIPALLTGPGFRTVLLHALPATARAVAGESWVLGHQEQIPTDGPAVAALEVAVTRLWAADAERAWDGLFADLALATPTGRDEAVKELYVLSAPHSPLRDLLAAIAQALTVPPPPSPSGAQAQSPRGPILVESAAAAPAPDAGEAEFMAHYRPLRDLVAGGTASSLDDVLRLVEALDRALASAGVGAALSADAIPAAVATGGDPAQLLLAEAGRQPAPVAGWLRQIASFGTRTLDGEAQQAASSAFAAADGPGALCRSVVKGHFPFDPQSADDAPIGDFARLFAPDGVLDRYFRANLAPFVDTSGATWRIRRVGGIAAPVSAPAVAAFQRAAAIRAVFFPAGSAPMVSFSVEAPQSGDVALTLGATTVGGGGSRTASLTWPGADGLADARLVSTKGAASLAAETGPWALFRLIRDGSLEPTSPGVWQLSFPGASFVLKAGSQHSPFGRDLLAGYACPDVR